MTPDRVFDEYLVVLSQAGFADALDGLARRWTPRLLRYAARALGGSSEAVETARDVVQDTWVGAIRGLRSLRDPAQFPAWIYGIATRKCADAIRARTRLRVHAGAVVGVEADKAQSIAPEHRIDLAIGIGQLPPEQCAVVHLFYGEDLSVEEVAAALAIPAGTVKSRLHHARETLRCYMGAAPSAENDLREAALERRKL
ncbi:MAG: sigma-70 family RNA polymerase sigma factor [Acidobacteria bacterium]|nr:sigma-70 family RNA polymerase sigma factor [Acidobacteriota bacterium]